MTRPASDLSTARAALARARERALKACGEWDRARERYKHFGSELAPTAEWKRLQRVQDALSRACRALASAQERVGRLAKTKGDNLAGAADVVKEVTRHFKPRGRM